MKRRSFSIASTLSLLLCVATAVLWVGSHRYNDMVNYITAGHGAVSIESDAEGFILAHRTATPQDATRLVLKHDAQAPGGGLFAGGDYWVVNWAESVPLTRSDYGWGPRVRTAISFLATTKARNAR